MNKVIILLFLLFFSLLTACRNNGNTSSSDVSVGCAFTDLPYPRPEPDTPANWRGTLRHLLLL